MYVNEMPRYEILSEEAMDVLDRGWRRRALPDDQAGRQLQAAVHGMLARGQVSMSCAPAMAISTSGWRPGRRGRGGAGRPRRPAGAAPEVRLGLLDPDWFEYGGIDGAGRAW